MTMNTSIAFRELSDDEVLARVHAAVRDERVATAHLIALLLEIDTRRLYLSESCSSLFTYCTQVLHLSEHAAYNRIETARAARRFPMISRALQDSGDSWPRGVRKAATRAGFTAAFRAEWGRIDHHRASS
jgi:hypothetical protein